MDDGTRRKFSEGLAVLETLMTPKFSDTYTSTVKTVGETPSLTWEALFTRLSALQTAVSALNELDDDMHVVRAAGSDGQGSDEEWSDVEGEGLIAETGGIGHSLEVARQPTKKSAQAEAMNASPSSTTPTHQIAAVQPTVSHSISTETTPATSTQQDSKDPIGSIFSTAPTDSSQLEPVEFSFRRLSHQLSDLSSSLITEWNHTKIDLAAESKRSRNLELERDVAVLEREELEERLQDAEARKDAAIGERDDLQILLQQAAALKNTILEEKTKISSRLQAVGLERDVVAKEKEDLKRENDEISHQKDTVMREKFDLSKRLRQSDSQVYDITKEKDQLSNRFQQTQVQLKAVITEKKELSKGLQNMTSQKEALEKEKWMLIKRIEKAYMQRDAAVGVVDSLTAQVQGLTAKRYAITQDMDVTSKQLRKTRSQLDNIVKEKQELTRRVSRLRSERGDAILAKDLISAQLKQEESHNSTLKAAQEKSTKELAALNFEHQILQRINATLYQGVWQGQVVQFRIWGDELALTFLNPTHTPKHKEMPIVNDLFRSIEFYKFPIKYVSLRNSGIVSIMNRIAVLHTADVPRDDEYRFRHRAKELIKRWAAIDNAPRTSLPA
ncbi:hypothetical protein ONZ45_g10415 [Pleurotus djamor]|nr:hypothetical protein ONZ45_g10415 [Pleurotus djamor]